MPPARLSPAEIIADVPSPEAAACAKLSRAVSVTTSRQATAKSFIFTLCKSGPGEYTYRSDKHTDNNGFILKDFENASPYFCTFMRLESYSQVLMCNPELVNTRRLFDCTIYATLLMTSHGYIQHPVSFCTVS